MANKKLFKSLVGKLIPATDALNEERAPAYALAPKHALAQYAATGCLNATFTRARKNNSQRCFNCVPKSSRSSSRAPPSFAASADT